MNSRSGINLKPLILLRGLKHAASFSGLHSRYRLGVGFVPIRKRGKLPHYTHEATYDLEYGCDAVVIHQDAFPKESRVLICDDVLATGGTLAASVELIEKLEGHIVGIAVLIELLELNGRERVPDYDIFSLIKYQ